MRLSYLILGLLRSGGARHGYALMKEYRRASGQQISIGNFYRELPRLQVEGLIEPRDNPPGADARRMPYAITAAGAAAFDGWLSRRGPNGIVNHDDEHSLKAFFVLRGREAVAERVLENWQEELDIRRRTLERDRDEAFSRGEVGCSTLLLWLGRRLGHLAVDLDFVKELRVQRLAIVRADNNGGSSAVEKERGGRTGQRSTRVSVRRRG